VLAPLFLDFADAVEHQHWRERQLGVTGTEQVAARAGQKVIVIKLIAPL
jgi:hypothetical protein